MTISFIQYSDAASSSDPNVKNFCDRISPFYKADKSGTLEKYGDHPFLKLCSFHSGSQASSVFSNHSTKSSSISNDYVKNSPTHCWGAQCEAKVKTSNNYVKNSPTHCWGAQCEAKVKTSNDYVKTTSVPSIPDKTFDSNYWKNKFAKSIHNFDIPNEIPLKKITPIKTPDQIHQMFKPRHNDYQAFSNDYKPHTFGNNWKDQYSPQHPVNNPANSNWNQPTFTWSPTSLPFWND